MPTRQDLEALFLRHLTWIDRIVASLCRRNSLAGADAEDFASWTRMKLVEDDYAVLGKFRGESALTTYLTVVISMLYREYRVSRWGRWRPSAAARRHGPLAVRLETLVHRDGYRLEQAAELLQTSGEAQASQGELARLLAQFPHRDALRPVEVGADLLEETPAPAAADDLAVRRETAAQRERLDRALAHAMEQLPAEDRVILRMRYWEGLSVADVARGLDLPQKPLYRRIDRALAQLRAELTAAGISREEVGSLIGDEGAE